MSTCGHKSVLPTLRTTAPCQIDAEVKKRNGQPLWWCVTHGQPAAATGGGPSTACPGAALPALNDALDLCLADYPGGVALWGAVPPPVSWGTDLEDLGVHVHARRLPNGPKDIDRTVTRLSVRRRPADSPIEICGASATAAMVSNVAGILTVDLLCPGCGFHHLDRDRFAAWPHRKHVCNRCGRDFWATTHTVSNPLSSLVAQLGLAPPPLPQRARRHCSLRREGSQKAAIWASNPAILWTAQRPETAGLHVHAWDTNGVLQIDETFNSVDVDGHLLDGIQIRLKMAQQAVAELVGRIVALDCPACHAPQFDQGGTAFTPSNNRLCSACGATFATPRRKEVVANPIVPLIASFAP